MELQTHFFHFELFSLQISFVILIAIYMLQYGHQQYNRWNRWKLEYRPLLNEEPRHESGNESATEKQPDWTGEPWYLTAVVFQGFTMLLVIMAWGLEKLSFPAVMPLGPIMGIYRNFILS